MSASIFDVEFASLDSGVSSDRISPRDLEGHVVVIVPEAYLASVETIHGPTDAVQLKAVHDVTDQKSYYDQRWFQRKLVGQLKTKVGEYVPAVMGKGAAQPGKSAPWELHSATEAQKQAAKDYLAAL